MKIKGELPYQFEPEHPQNMTFWESLDKQQYDEAWKLEKEVQEEWNRAHFTGFRAGHYFRDGQRPPKK